MKFQSIYGFILFFCGSCLSCIAAEQNRSNHFSIVSEDMPVPSAVAEVNIKVNDGRTDENTGHLLPVGVIVTDRSGKHIDGAGRGLYSDGRFYVEGEFELKVDSGRIKIKINAGPDYKPLELTLDVTAGKRYTVKVSMAPWFEPEKRGWYGGDNHVHVKHDKKGAIKADLSDAVLQGRACGLSFITEAGSNISYDGLADLNTDNFILKVAPELRLGPYVGHLNTPGISSPIDNNMFKEIERKPLATQRIIEEVHKRGGVVTYTHPFSPAYQLHWMGATNFFSDVACNGCGDLFDVDSRLTELLWFTALDIGVKIACSSYTDTCLERPNACPPGARRIYCHVRSFDYRSIVQAMRSGKTFATNGGPVFPFLTIDSHEPGDTITLDKKQAYNLHAEVHTLHPLKSAQLYRNGNVIKEFQVMEGKGTISYDYTFNETSKSWYLFRTEDKMGHWAITSPIYFEPDKPEYAPNAHAILFEIANHSRSVRLRPNYFAHMLLTLSREERFDAVELLNGKEVPVKFTPDMGNKIVEDTLPVTMSDGKNLEYVPDWLWYPEPDRSFHFQADWPVVDSGWYSIRAVTKKGRTLVSDKVYFDSDNPNSHEISVAHLNGENATFVLWGYGEGIPLSEVTPPYSGDSWWFPENTYWSAKAVLEGKSQNINGGSNPKALRYFLKSAPAN